SPSSAGPTPTTTAPSAPVPARVSVAGVVASDLEVPWGVAFLPDGAALVAERDTARLVRVGPDGAVARLGVVPGVRHGGEGGLLGLAVSPAFATDRTVFAYHTASGDNRVVRVRLDGDRLGTPVPVLTGIPAGGIHNGGRIVFGPDGALWIGTGEVGDPDLAQDRRSLGGKILRIRPDGSVPADNPFPGSPVWSYGHRNVQGLAFDSRGRLWASELGQKAFDELNLVVRGGNHGWPRVEGVGNDGRYVDPVATWRTSEASPSGIAIVDDVVYVAALRGERLWQVPITGDGAGEPRAFLAGDLGRLRTVVTTPDGTLWVTTSNRDGRGDPAEADDRILRLALSG
ncbi:MAG: PQQ-dependent sugar dehydrogenase, partial [Actinomycetia bacterium]|nr:PQQ-dependent sugar dehydrogenase [Actinomycetes bacterium]